MRFLKRMRMAMLTCGIVVGSVTGLQAVPTAAHRHAHAHPTEGPHHGSLIELGKEDYHAEIVHDETTDTVTIYILDGSATKPVPTTTKNVTLNMRVSGKPQQFPLAAVPQTGDPAGSASAFAASGKPLCQALDAHGAAGRLNVEIAGKMYVGTLGGHSHAHQH